MCTCVRVCVGGSVCSGVEVKECLSAQARTCVCACTRKLVLEMERKGLCLGA